VRVATILRGLGWQVLPEVTFQHYGERGSIDLLALRAVSLAACVIELKTAVYSYEEMQRTLDVKGRLVAEVVWQRVGWRPRHVGTVLVLEETTTNRRRLRSIEPLLRAGLPGSAWDVRRWLADPAGLPVTDGAARVARDASLQSAHDWVAGLGATVRP
jgi:hypothetical protein